MTDQELTYKDCRFSRKDGVVTFGNSRIERAWRVGQHGLTTIHLRDTLAGRDWAMEEGAESILTTDDGLVTLNRMELDSLSAEVVETPVSEPCLRMRVTLSTPGLVCDKYFDLYPEVPAIRTWLCLQSDMGISNLDYTRVDILPLDLSNARMTAVELHDLTDATNHLATVHGFGLSEACRPRGNHVFLETTDGHGIFGYKESPVPNAQLYHMHYDFTADRRGLAGVGAGFHDLPAGRVRRTYAFAFGVYSGGHDRGLLALKEYQAARYKTVPSRDYIVSSNSWGDFHTDINEENMLAEVEAAARLGVECVAVDAGWTRHIMGGDPDPEKFPRGFAPLVSRARELGVKLELWTVPNRLHDALDAIREHPDWVARTNNLVPCDNLRSYWDTNLVGIDLCHPDCFAYMKDYYLHFHDQGFERFKMDTFQCDGYDTQLGDLSDHYEALRRLMEELVVERPGLTFTQDSTRTNRPIYDYYMDYGVIFLENRYQHLPPEANGRYRPWKTLANLWQIAPYIPPQKLNMEMCNDEEGYSAEYLLATVMFANPLLWESLAAIQKPSQEALKPAIALYKQYRAGILAGHIFPLGDRPDGTSWTGFQSHNPATASGYMIVYREDAPETSHLFVPKFLDRPTIFESLSDSTPPANCACTGQGLEVSLPAKRTFRLYRYVPAGGSSKLPPTRTAPGR